MQASTGGLPTYVDTKRRGAAYEIIENSEEIFGIGRFGTLRMEPVRAVGERKSRLFGIRGHRKWAAATVSHAGFGPAACALVVLHKSNSVSCSGTENQRRESSLNGRNNIAQDKRRSRATLGKRSSYSEPCKGSIAPATPQCNPYRVGVVLAPGTQGGASLTLG